MLSVRPISPTEHLTFLEEQRSASFLQTPAWGQVKSEWRRESLGWYDGEALVGVALVLYRQLPKVKRYLAYLPEGPVIDWTGDDLAAWLEPLTTHLKGEGAFGVRLGPPVVTRRWTAAQVKEGIADDGVRRLGDLAPDPARAGRGARGRATARARLAAAGGRGRLRGRAAAVRLPDPARRRRSGRAPRRTCSRA